MIYSLTFTVSPGLDAVYPEQRREPGRNGAPDSPIRDDFPPGPAGAQAYVQAWHIWRTQIADGVPTRAERAERAEVLAPLFGVPVVVADRLSLGQLRLIGEIDPRYRDMVIETLAS